jgi:hypothetical protein
LLTRVLRSGAGPYRPGFRLTPPPRGRTPEQRLVYEKRRHIDFLKHLVRRGYARRTPGGVRPTLRGAIVGAWRHVFPWREIDRWWVRRRARTVLRLG